jgi:uncharacterized protein (DUF885 family)
MRRFWSISWGVLTCLVACAAEPPQHAGDPAAQNLARQGPSAQLRAAASVAPAASAPPAAFGATGPAGAPAAALPDDAAISQACDAYIEMMVALSPEYATSIGRHERDDVLDDRSTQAIERALDKRRIFLRETEARFATVRASAPAKIDLELLLGTLRADLAFESAVAPQKRQPDFYTAPMHAFFLMGARDYAPKAARADAMLKRMMAIPNVVLAAKANLTTPPRIWTEIGIDQAKSASGFFEGQRAFLEAALPGETPRIALALRSAKAAYADYESFLRTTILPRSNGSFRLGRETFEVLLKQRYALTESADEVLALGHRVFADIEQNMNTLARKMDPSAKDFTVVIAKLKGNHPKAPELLAEYRKEVLRARAFLLKNDIVAFPPGDDLEVVDTPPFMRSTVTAAYDQPPPFDPGSKGFFFVTPVDPKLSKQEQEQMLRENDHGDIVDTAVHEAYPGHHLQLSFARMHPSRMRKVTDAAIFSEGWALYSEELMSELGYYTDEERMLQLEWALVRAARIIIDVGLHAGSMTLDEAIRLLVDRVRLGPGLARSEVKRYSESPAQPLAYMVGREKLMQLREAYKKREGDTFTLKRFHSEVLSRGTIAPGYLQREIMGP